MSRKIFVTYKHSDNSVSPIGREGTARGYVEELITLFEGDEIYKGEGNEDLSDFKDEVIASRLKDKIYDSSVTIILISPNMKDPSKSESDQWIPWEVSYSLKEITRDGRTSRTNAMLAVVLPDVYSSYRYFMEDSCQFCNAITFNTGRLFKIIGNNMFNIKNPKYSECPHHPDSRPVYTGRYSYIYSVKWNDFVGDKERYLSIAENIRDHIDGYNITKTV